MGDKNQNRERNDAVNIKLCYNQQSAVVNYSFCPAIVTVSANLSLWPCVPNMVRCYLQYNGSSWQSACPKVPTKRLALIVEAPHKDEYNAWFYPIAPLQGAAGKRFNQKIIAKLGQWQRFLNPHNQDTFEIKIFNPVPIQTSLYHFLNNMVGCCPQPYAIGKFHFDRKMCNAVWNFCFTQCGFDQRFVNELINYNPDYIINCCTGNKHSELLSSLQYQKSLKRNVAVAIKKNLTLKSIPYQQDNHPRTW